MHNVDFKSAYKPYIIFEIYHVKYTNFVQSYTWPHFHFIVLLNFHINTIFMHNVDFKSVKSHVYHVKYKDLI